MLTVKPAGVAWVTVAVVTRPVAVARGRMAGRASPSGVMLSEPFFTWWPQPQAEEAAAESVTSELADEVFMSARRRSGRA
jgi:hypothetical protein